MQLLEGYLEKKSSFIILLIILLSLGLRIIYYREIQDTPVSSWHLWQDCDMNFFDLWAKNIAGGDWWTENGLHPYHRLHDEIAKEAYPDKNFSLEQRKKIWEKWFGGKRFHQEPLYPYLLAIIYKMSGNEVSWVFGLQLFLGIVNQVLIYLLTRKYFGNIPAILATFLALLYGPFKLYETTLLRTTLLTFLGLLTVWMAGIALTQKNLLSFFFAGLIFGINLITKSTILVFIFLFLPVTYLYFKNNLKGWLLAMVSLGLGFLLPLLPVMIRNIKVQVPPMEMSSVGAYAFINFNTADFKIEECPLLSKYAGTIMRETDGKFLPAVLKSIQTYPCVWDYGKLLLQKFLLFWDDYEIPGNLDYYYCSQYSPLLYYGQTTFFPINILCLIGLILAFKDFKKNWFLYIFFFHCLFFQVLFHNLSRFRTPIVAILIPFAAYGLYYLIEKIANKKYLSFGILTLCLAVLTFISFFFSLQRKSSIPLGEYLLGNHLCTIIMKEKVDHGDFQGALRTAEKCIETEPYEIKGISGEIVINPYNQKLAASFADIHLWAALLNQQLKNGTKFQYHQGRHIWLKKIAELKPKDQ